MVILTFSKTDWLFYLVAYLQSDFSDCMEVSAAALKGRSKMKRSYKIRITKSTFTCCYLVRHEGQAVFCWHFFFYLMYLAAHNNSMSKTNNKTCLGILIFHQKCLKTA